MDERQKLALAVAVSGTIGVFGGAALSAMLLKWRDENRAESRRSSVTSVCDRCSFTPSSPSLRPTNSDAVDHMAPGGDAISTGQTSDLSQLLASNREMSETLKMLEAKISQMDSVLRSRTLSRSSSSLGGYATANESPDYSDDEFAPAEDREAAQELSLDDHSGDEIYFHTQTHSKPKTALTENGGILRGATSQLTEPPVPEPSSSEPDYVHIDTLLCSEQHDDNRQGFDLLTKLRQENSTVESRPEFLWRIAKATHQQSLATRDLESKKALAFQAKELAFQALGTPDGAILADVHKWCAITIGNLGDYVSIQEKISNGSTFKQRIDEAIRLNPSDEMSHYLMGRWCYSVYMMSWVERKVATSLVSDFPQTSIDEALQAFQKAEACKPGFWVDNQLYLAKCFIENSSYGTAMIWLDKAAVLPRKKEDEASHSEVDALRIKYSSYRTA